MDRLHEIHTDSIYYDFKRIEERAYLEKIKFFEKNKDRIEKLDIILSTEIWFYYSQSSFEVGDYRKYIKLSEILLPRVIEENIYYFGSINVYETILFHKGACHLNLEEFDEADHIFSELVKIDKTNILYKRVFLQNQFAQKIRASQPIKLFSAVLFLLVLGCGFFEMLFISPFYPELLTLVSTTREYLILALFGVVVLYSGYHYFIARRRLLRLLK